jgi:hypothetical protein
MNVATSVVTTQRFADSHVTWGRRKQMRLFSYRPSPDFLVAIVIIAAVVAATVYLIGGILFWQQAIEDKVTQRVTIHLPTECAEYYEDGTDKWKDCMGVGLK